jgi:hypothetical protein
VGMICSSVVQDHVQQRAVDAQTTVVFDEPYLAEFVHEKADPRTGSADHLGQRFLAWLIPLSQVNQNLGLAGQIRNGAGFEFFGRS